jgi:hypothetical protein
MTIRPPRARGNTKHLKVAQADRSGLLRHPKDGWQLADPYPLGPRARLILRALIDALCPRSRAPRPSDLGDRVELGARRMLRYMHPFVARALWVGLFLLDWLPVLTLSSRGRLHRLSPDRASALVARYARSRVRALRLLVTGMRGLVLGVYFDQSEVHEAMRYAPVGFLRDRIQLRTELVHPAVVLSGD